MKTGQFIALLVCITFCFCLLSFSIVYAANHIALSIESNGSLIRDGLIEIRNILLNTN